MEKEKTSALKEYLDAYGIKQNWFAVQLGISRKTISCICNGKKCSTTIALMIENYTDGDVKAEEICGNINGLNALRNEL